MKIGITTSKNISGNKVGEYIRCAAVADVELIDAIFPKSVRIASIHLTGGKFVDTNWKDYSGAKTLEIKNTLSLSPDVVLGDLNSYRNVFGVMSNQGSYEPYTTARSAGEEAGYISWAMEGAMALEGSHHRLEANKDTTRYGGTIDHIFVKKNSDLSFGHELA